MSSWASNFLAALRTAAINVSKSGSRENTAKVRRMLIKLKLLRISPRKQNSRLNLTWGSASIKQFKIYKSRKMTRLET